MLKSDYAKENLVDVFTLCSNRKVLVVKASLYAAKLKGGYNHGKSRKYEFPGVGTTF